MRTQVILALAAVGLAAGAAQAQIGPRTGPQYGPGYRANVLSPYLDLARTRTGFSGIDYYLGTRAETQRRQDREIFSEGIDELDRRDRDLLAGEEDGQRSRVQTGTGATFGNTRGYYNNRQNYLSPTVGRMGAGVGVQASPGRRR